MAKGPKKITIKTRIKSVDRTVYICANKNPHIALQKNIKNGK